MADEPREFEPSMDAAELYREELYTDRKVGTIRVMVPVKSDGSTDTARRTSYVGQAQIMTNAGMLPIRTNSALSRAMMGAGVPAGATSPK